MTREPHFVRFAQALALVTGLAGCGGATEATVDAGDEVDAAIVADASQDEDAASEETDAATGDDASTEEVDAAVADAGELDCTSCICFGEPGVDAGSPSCDSVGLEIPCCAAVGPLSPPDLVV